MRAERRRSRRGEVIEAAHDGYKERFGLMHERILAMTQDGSRFIGQDRLVAAESAKKKDAKDESAAHEFSARFHLHPSVGAAPQADGRGIELALPSGARCCSKRAAIRQGWRKAFSSPRPRAPAKRRKSSWPGPRSQACGYAGRLRGWKISTTPPRFLRR